MKFLSLALAAMLAEAASAAQSLSSDQLNAMLRSGKIDKNTVLKYAVPYQKKNFRKLEDNGENDADQAEEADAQEEDADAADQADAQEDDADAADQADAQEDGADAAAEEQQDSNYYYKYGALGKTGITGDHSVMFNSCVSLTVEEDWDQVENFDQLEYYIQQGEIQSVRNYVLFNVCETLGDCLTPEISEQNTYMVDLNTWVTAMIDYLPNQKDAYCEGCWNQQSYCSNTQMWSSQTNIDYTKANFFYDDIKFQLIDCEQCELYQCYNEDGDVYEQNGWDDVDEWIYELAQCSQTGYQFQGVEMNAGFMCNQYGTGLEIAIFMDEDCTLYNSKKSYTKMLGNNNDAWVNYGKSQRIINYLFNYMFDCYGGDLIYVNLLQQVYSDENGWAYDPCQTDSYTGEVSDQDACDEMINNNPCYITYDEDGNQNEIDEDQCAEFMSVYPCWTMPGGTVSADYEEACYEYKAQYSHQANDACSALFGNQNNQQNNNAEGGAFVATALSACRYNFETGGYDGAQEDNQANAEYQAQNWTLTLTYDITQDMTDNPTAICDVMDTLFVKGNHLDDQVYDATISGQLYSYEDLGEETSVAYYDSSSSSSSSGGNSTSSSSSSGGWVSNTGGNAYTTYFPTVPSSVQKVVKKSRKMSPGAIVGTTLATAAAVFLMLFAGRRCVKCCTRKSNKHYLADPDQKDLPLMT